MGYNCIPFSQIRSKKKFVYGCRWSFRLIYTMVESFIFFLRFSSNWSASHPYLLLSSVLTAESIKKKHKQFFNHLKFPSRSFFISLPSTISCFIFWNSLRTSLIISALNASISWAVSTAPSLTPFTFKSVSSEAEPNLLRTDFGDSAPFENLLLDELFLSHFLSGELSGS